MKVKTLNNERFYSRTTVNEHEKEQAMKSNVYRKPLYSLAVTQLIRKPNYITSVYHLWLVPES